MENLNGTGHPILIVEDDGKLARVLQVYLEGAGYRTVRAATGTQALEAFSREPPLLVLLDLMLPDMPGESLAQEFRKKGTSPSSW
jgi:two-component system OmpR family response regulator